MSTRPNTGPLQPPIDDEDKEIRIPYGLDPNSLQPSSLNALTEEKLKAFSLGIKKKSPFQKHKEEVEAKKKRNEDDAARVLDEFMRDFSGGNTTQQTFIRGETMNNSVITESSGDREYVMAKPTSSLPQTKKEGPLPIVSNPIKEDPQAAAKKKKCVIQYEARLNGLRSIDELKQELQKKQETMKQNKKPVMKFGNGFINKPPGATGFSSTPPSTKITPLVEEKSQPAEPVEIVQHEVKQHTEPVRPDGPQPIVLTPSHNDVQLWARRIVEGVPHIEVQIPTDLQILANINALAAFVVREGFQFEKVIMDKEKKDPNGAYSFLFHPGDLHNYYRWRIYALLSGDNDDGWREAPFKMYTEGPLWMPPPPKKKKQTHKSGFERDFDDILNKLTTERESIKQAMGFALDHSHHSEIISKLFLLSDILHNCSAPVPKASTYRSNAEGRLSEIFQSLAESHRNIQGRITAENLKELVMKVIRLWSDWAIYPNHFMDELGELFMKKP
ncbi:putative U2-associated splicing factor [Planoprotostelium fungivorum]|uniref:Putative U2-associated splicing factor n=1 Tax=Planoprotostelium fungivorum TaxID=1890364 RepID=A0A2P6NCS0_9EUKA|nr:putative U2-associated splicing factor [Planoprotostelium fungivorum]